MRVPLKRLIAATDFSDMADVAVHYGIRLAREFGAKLYLCHVIPFSSTISLWWDTWIVDGSVRLLSFAVKLASYPTRLLQTGLVQSEKQRRPECVEEQLDEKEQERDPLAGEATALPDQPGSHRHDCVKSAPHRSEDPLGRIPGRLSQARIPLAREEKPAHRRRRESCRHPASERQG